MSDERISPVDEAQLLRAAACDWRLSRGDVGVMAVLLKHANAEWKAFPGPTLIGKTAELDPRNVKESLKKLEALHYIKVIRPGERKANRYVVLESPLVVSRKTSAIIDACKRELGMPASPALGMRASPDRARRGRPTGDESITPTGDESIHQLGMPASPEVAFKSPLKSRVDCSSSEEQERSAEELKAAAEAERAKRRQSIRSEYLKIRSSNPRAAQRMVACFPRELADLINPNEGRLPPLVP
jgi:hypothetical protein